MLLLNPGPVTLTERVRRSLLQADLCHREPEFYDLQDEARARLLAVHQLDPKEWSAVLMTASGTAAVEGMLAALVPETGRVLVVENGVYGERMAQICSRYRIAHERIIGSWMDAPDLASIAATLDAGAGKERFTHVAVVHHETTTGRLNDLHSLASLCQSRAVKLLVDGVSSFGAEKIDFADGTLAAVAATANKCLHGVPGASFVIARRHALNDAVSRAYYLDLGRLAGLQDQRNTPFTPAVHVYYALVEALGIEGVLPHEQSSVVLRSYRLPSGITYPVLHDALKADGFVIYAGQGDLSKTLFRISTMGDLASSDIERLIESVARVLRP
jgi:2-aminoethylphosphonate-pyruvate transaminase